MNILFVCNEYPPVPHGGIGTFTFSLASQLAAQGHHISVIGYDPTVSASVWSSENGISIFRIRSPYRKMRSLRFLYYELNPAFLLERMYLSKQVNRVVREKEIDLVESYDWSGPLWSKPPVPLIVRLHGAHTAHAVFEKLHVSRLLRFVEKRNVRMADELVAVSEHIGYLTMDSLPLTGKHFTVIYNGVDTRLFHPVNSPRRVGRILFVGRVQRRKGIYELFRAFAIVSEVYPSAELVVAGRLPDDTQTQLELLQLLPEGASERVTFLGPVPFEQLADIYSQASVAVFPSQAEAFGLTCVEAMACATPVIMTSRSSGPEIVEHGVSGLLVDPTSPQSIADAILSLLYNEPLREQIGMAGRERVIRLFDLASTISNNIALYANLISR